MLWDVDGTLVDASEGILRRLTIAHEHFGFAPPTRDQLIHWIGPPMFESFQVNLGMTPEQSADAVTFYRSLHADGGAAAGARVFPGMAELMAEVAESGIPQATASSKPENQVVEIMDHFDLARFLTATVGSTPDEKTLAGKAAVVRESLRRLVEAGVDVSRPVLVGDRHHDVEGGAETGVPVIFVTWGFSDPAEADGSIATATTVDELRNLLLG